MIIFEAAREPEGTMSRSARKELIEKLQVARGNRLVIAYVTSTRENQEIQIGDDAVRIIYDHLEANKESVANGIDLFIHSNGGSGTAPWRIVSLIRQYTKKLSVLVPHHAFSAATLLALGANEIVMHKMGCLGPIDPSVANIFNPPHPMAPGQPARISVEDVTAFFKLVKDDVGITHEDELVKALTALTDKIHPLALGNVQRSHHQSRLIARKLLKLHMPKESQEHEIESLIDSLKSNLFYHGHPINREEAKVDLKLKVVTPTANVELAMWNLYLEYERDLKLREPFVALRELELKEASNPPQVPLVPGSPQPGTAIGPIGMPMMLQSQLGAKPSTKLDPILGAYIESVARADAFRTELAVSRVQVNTPAGPQEALKQELLRQVWEEEK
jgi:hypothetical protein